MAFNQGSLFLTQKTPMPKDPAQSKLSGYGFRIYEAQVNI